MTMNYNEEFDPLSRKGLTFHRVININVILAFIFTIFWLRRDYKINSYDMSSLSILSIFLTIIIVATVLLNIFSVVSAYLEINKNISFQKTMAINISVIFLLAMFLLWRDWVNFYQFLNLIFSDNRLKILVIGIGMAILAGILLNLFYVFSKKFVQRYDITFRKLIIMNTGLSAAIAVLIGFRNFIIQQHLGDDNLVTLIPVVVLFLLNVSYIRNVNYVSESDFSFRRLIIINIIALLIMLFFSTLEETLNASDMGIIPNWMLLSYTISIFIIALILVFNIWFASKSNDDDSYNKMSFDVFIIINIALFIIHILIWMHRSWQPFAFLSIRYSSFTVYGIIAASMIIGALGLNIYFIFKNYIKRYN